MKNKLKLFLVALGVVSCMTAFGACESTSESGSQQQEQQEQLEEKEQQEQKEQQEEKKEEKDITGVTFDGVEKTYDGETVTLAVSELPDGIKVEYKDNVATDAGVYHATATLTGDGYRTLVLNSDIVINKATFTGITFEDKTVDYSGTEQSIVATGVPSFATVAYTCAENKNITNKATDTGTYTVTVTVSDKNYETFTDTAVLTIKVPALAAKDIINTVLDVPDAWEYLPEKLRQDSMAYSTAPQSVFTAATSVNNIGKRQIGREMKVVYDILSDASLAYKALFTVKASGELIATAYQSFLDTAVDTAIAWTGTVSGISLKITHNSAKNETVFLAGNSQFNMRLAIAQDGTKTGRIQLSDLVAIAYTAKENSLKLDAEIEAKGVGIFREIDFERKDGVVEGYVYERNGKSNGEEGSDWALKANAYLCVKNGLVCVTSNKRELDTMKVVAFEEVYSATTGEYIGGEIEETVASIDYDTYWYNLYSVSGFNSIKYVEKTEETNAYFVVNNATEPFVNTKYGGLSLKTASRRYDIEMKTVWYVVKTLNEKNEYEYSMVQTEIPMLFVQAEKTSDFGSDVKKANGTAFTAAPVLPANTSVADNYESGKEKYLSMTEKTILDIHGAIGEKDEFFVKTED